MTKHECMGCIAATTLAFTSNSMTKSSIAVRNLAEATKKTSTTAFFTSDIVFGFAGDTLTGASATACGDILAQWIEHQTTTAATAAGSHSRHTHHRRSNSKPLAAASSSGGATVNCIDGFALDVRRTKAYALFGAAYTGAFQHVLFSSLNQFVHNPTLRLTINQGIIIPLLYYPLLKWLVPKLRGRTPQERKKLRQNIRLRKMIPKNWAYWIPLQFLQFNVIPQNYHVLFVSFVGLIWTIILSCLTAGGGTAIATAAFANESTMPIPSGAAPS